MDYLIGDTIRLKATIKNLVGEEEAPMTISVKVCKLDGTELLEATEPDLINGTTSQYYYDWEIDSSLKTTTQLIVIWDWSGPHKKKLLFTVIPVL
ncbi:hypothetical protein ES705_49061 [subsurface metagenome]